MEGINDLLVRKFQEIERRIKLVLDQLNEEELNWRPNESSNSIANLIIHIEGNIGERVSKGINKKDYDRHRDEEFEQVIKKKSELTEILERSFFELIETTKNMTEELMSQSQIVRNKERSNLDILMQCATHFSEHLGQVLYIGKMIRNHDYITTSIPKKKL